jgi:hypothetical protein
VALIGQIAVAMKVETVKFGKGLNAAGKMLGGFETRLYRTGGLLTGLFAGAAGVGALAGIKKMITASSDITEATNLMQVVFGDASKEILADSDKMAAAFGNSKKEYLDAAGMFGGIFKQMGYGQAETAKLSVAMVHLADDMSSQKNISFADSLIKIKGGLTGESESLKSVGVLIDEATVKQYAYAHGVAAMGAELTQAQKVQARMGVLTAALADAQGDHARTANEVAGAMKGLSGRVENLAADLGKTLEPMAKAVLGDLNVGLMAIKAAWDASGQAAMASATAQGGAAEGAATSVGVLQGAVMSLADSWQSVQTKFLAAQASITSGVGWMIKNLPGFAEGINKLMHGDVGVKVEGPGFGKEGLTVGHPGRQTVSDADFKNAWLEELDRIGKAQADALKTQQGAAPLSETIKAQFDTARQKIEEGRKEFLKQPDISGIKAPAAAADTSKHKEVKFASAAALGSQEATNAILRSRFGKGGKATADEAKKTATNTAKANEYLSKIATAVSTQAAGVLVPI